MNQKIANNSQLDEGEKKYLTKLKITEIIFAVLAIPFCVLIYLILRELDFIPSRVRTVFLIICIFVILIINMDISSEIHRIKSGYYKKRLVYGCKSCYKIVTLDFNDLKKYDSLPRRENGVRLLSCPHCGLDIPLYGYDSNLESYKKFLKKTRQK